MFAVIMAGGSGTRFWPLSRKARPKQFLAIGTEAPLLVETIHRLALPWSKVYVAAGATHVPALTSLLPDLDPSHHLIEPCPRNTAPCIGLAAIHLARQDPDEVMAVLPADHHIADVPAFLKVLETAHQAARAGAIVTLGIRPSRPETGYGYIQFDPAGGEVCTVTRFVEKPPRAVAEGYLADGGYLWNSGVFFFTPRRILSDIRRLIPNLATGLDRIAAAIDTPHYEAVLAQVFADLPSVSIDYGVMEHAEGVQVVPAEVGWNDVGHWAALPDFAPQDAAGNVVRGLASLVDATGNIVYADGPTVALVGVQDLVVVATPDAILVCPKDRAQDVRLAVSHLEAAGRKDLL